MKNEKKAYESPIVTKVEFDATNRITANGCTVTGADLEECTAFD